MVYWKCKCGESEYFGSGMTPQDCEGCEKCGTNYRKEAIKPHQLKVKYSEKTGEPSYQECKVCYERISL
jgi:MinD superfamily P-loop ATPase